MDRWLKGLIAVACVVVIGFGVNAVWGSITGAQDSQQDQMAKTRLFNLAGVQKGDEASMRVVCDHWSKSETMKTNPLRDEVVNNCRVFGYL